MRSNRTPRPHRFAVAAAIISILAGACGADLGLITWIETPGGTTVRAPNSIPVNGKLERNNAAVAGQAEFTIDNSSAASIAPTGQGRANNAGVYAGTFTAKPVTEDTPVTVTFDTQAADQTVVIIVKPAIVSGTWPIIVGTGGNVVNIAPSISRNAAGQLVCVYTITVAGLAGPATSTIKAVNATFAAPMTVTSTSTGGPGTADVPNFDNTIWGVSSATPSTPTTPGVYGWTSVTITAIGDANPGGTATFEVFENLGGVVNKVTITATGPTP